MTYLFLLILPALAAVMVWVIQERDARDLYRNETEIRR